MNWTQRRSAKLLLTALVTSVLVATGCSGGTKAGEVTSSDGKGEVTGNIAVA